MDKSLSEGGGGWRAGFFVSQIVRLRWSGQKLSKKR